jgi:hypothetical protein
MCGGHHYGRGFRGRHGFPSREQWLERLQAHQQQLERDLANVRELIERLGGGEQPAQQA